jgi:hypothetical protein
MCLAGLAQENGSLIDPEFSKLSTNQQLAVELISITFVIAFSIVIANLILRDVFDWQIAAITALFLALNPYHISLSQAIHVDALISIFALVSALLLWSYVKTTMDTCARLFRHLCRTGKVEQNARPFFVALLLSSNFYRLL